MCRLVSPLVLTVLLTTAAVADPTDAAATAAALEIPADLAKLPGMADALAKEPEVASLLRRILKQDAEAAVPVAETLVEIAERNRLGDDLAALAGELLASDDPFVRGLADWAIAMKVGHENNGQQATWPRADLPAWYRAYAAETPRERVENDWVRQAVARKIHRDPASLAASIDAMAARAARMADDLGVDRALAEKVAAYRVVVGSQSPADLRSAQKRWLDARRAMRDVALAQPAMNVDRLVFLEQFVPHTVRNITRSYSWKHKPGGDICILDGVGGGGTVERVLGGRLGPGYVWGLDLWWDADRVVFSYAKLPNWPPAVNTADAAVEGRNVFRLRQVFEPLHVYECRLDGSGLVQLTDDPYWGDFEPTYCANGDVVFASDRSGRAAECGNDSYDHTNPNLFILSRTDGRVRKFTDSKDIDRYPHSLDDGRIAYTHWEYQERHFMETHALWTARPDGTMSDALFKHHLRAPLALRDTRDVPGSEKLVSIATGHHTFAYGQVVLVDPAWGTNHAGGLAVVTPGVVPQEGPPAGKPVAQGGVPDAGGLYQTPWALSETCFLASYSYARPHCTGTSGADANGFGLYLIDVYGNRELLHRDPVLSCTFPIPLRQRERPPIVADMRGDCPDFRGAGRENGTVPLQPPSGMLRDRRLRRPAGRRAGYDQTSAGRPAGPLAVRPRAGPAGLHPRHGRREAPRFPGLGPGPRDRHGAGRGRRLGPLRRAGRHRHLLPGPRRPGNGGRPDAVVRELQVGRGPGLPRVPRVAGQVARRHAAVWHRYAPPAQHAAAAGLGLGPDAGLRVARPAGV